MQYTNSGRTVLVVLVVVHLKRPARWQQQQLKFSCYNNYTLGLLNKLITVAAEREGAVGERAVWLVNSWQVIV
jgi:hypothetical protein